MAHLFLGLVAEHRELKEGPSEAIVFECLWTSIEAKKLNNATGCRGDAAIFSHFHLFAAWHSIVPFYEVRRSPF
jgi:hypothetical protein